MNIKSARSIHSGIIPLKESGRISPTRFLKLFVTGFLLSFLFLLASLGGSGQVKAQSATGVLVDNSDPGFVKGAYSEPGGQPSYFDTVSSGYKGNALYTGNSRNTTPRNWGTWSAAGITGTLELSATIPPGPYIYNGDDSFNGTVLPLTTGAKYIITHAGGVSEKVVDQRANEGGTVSLGTYEFNGSGSVYLSDVVPETGGDLLSSVVFDLVSFGGDITNLDITPPKIEDVKAHANNGSFIIQAKITDVGSGVANAKVFFNGQFYPMRASGDIYSARIPYSANKNLKYYIVATDNAGLTSVWEQGRGYVSIGTFARNLGIPRWAFGGSYGCMGGNRCNSQYAGDPINTVNGNLTNVERVVKVGGRPEINLDITYNAQGGRETVFGERWTHSYNYHVLDMDNEDFVGAFVQYPDGQVSQFTGSSYTPEAGVFDKLTKTGDGFELLMKDMTKVIFDADGDIIRLEDPNGNGLDFSYGKKEKFTLLSQINTIKADGGREIKLNYDDKGHVKEIIAPEEKVLKFEYNDKNDLVKFIDGNSGETKFEYDEDHLMKNKITPKGHAAFENTFDGEKRVTKQKSGEAYLENFVYEGNTTKVTDANEKVITYEYNDDKLLVKLTDALSKSIRYEYNDKKNIKVMIDRDDNRYEYDYDEKGNKIYEKDPLGAEIKRTYDNTLNKILTESYKKDDHKTEWKYDGKGNLLELKNAKGDIRKFKYNDYGQMTEFYDFRENKTEYAYNSFGDLEKIIDAYTKAEVREYDGLGRLKKKINRRGIVYKYNLDKNDNLLDIEGPLGYKLSYRYDPNNNIIREVDANNGEVKYTYNKSEKIISRKNQLDFETKYIYGLMNEKLEEIDPEGRVTKFFYDPTYNIAEVKNAVGTTDEISTKSKFNGMRYQTEIIDPENRLMKINLDPMARVKERIQNATNSPSDNENNVTTKYEYSPTGALENTTDANGNKTNYKLDVLDQVTEKTDAENQTTVYEYDQEGNIKKVKNPRGYITEYFYDKLNRVEKIKDAKNGETKFEYDENGNQIFVIDANGVRTKFEYNELDRNTIKINNFVENGPVDAYTNVKTQYTYDLHGNLIKIINPRGFKTEYKYDKAHRNTQIIDDINKATVYEYDKVDNVKKIIDRNGHANVFEYDNLDRVTKSTNPEGHIETYSYDKTGNQLTFINKRGKKFTKEYDPLNRVKKATDVYGKTQISTYDPVGNLINFTDENEHTDRFEYDKVYRVRKLTDAESISTEYLYDQNGNIVKKIDGEGNPTDYAYDELDRLVSEKNAENEEERYGYDALQNLVIKYEADNTPHKYNYDKLYRLISVIDNYREGEDSSNDKNVKTAYEYDANGNLITQINALNNSTKFEYDNLDRLIKETNPLENAWKYNYDFVGNRTKRIDANGATTEYLHYADDILKTIKYPTYSVNYEYNETNFPIKMTDNLGLTTWDYDELDRMTSQKDPLNRNVNYKYDFVGNITEFKQPDSRFLVYKYLKNDWLAETRSSDNDEVKFLRNKVGAPTRLDRTNSSYSQVTYDKVYRPLNVHDQQIGSGDHLISDFKYTYNDIGHITNEISEYGWRQPSKVVTEYNYDGLHRMVESKSDNDEWSKYQYDAVGNRKIMQEYVPNKREFETRSSSFNAANQLLKIDIQSPMPPNVLVHEFKYDKNGNRTDKLIKDNTGVDRGVSYSYDVENRLLKAHDYKGEIIKRNPKDAGAYTINYLAHTDTEYDGNGRRLVKTYYSGASQPGKRTEYTYDRLDPIAQYDMWDRQYRNFYRDTDKNLLFFQGFKSQQDPKGTLYWYHYDGEGNIAATTKHRAQSDHTYRYDEYGGILPDNGNPASNGQEGPAAGWTAPHNSYTLTQKEYDANTNLYYFGSRYYDAVTGTWINQDSYRGDIKDPMSLHRYMYNNASPVNYIDKYGYSNVTLWDKTKVAFLSVFSPQLAQIEVNKKVFGEPMTNAQRDQKIAQQQYQAESTLKKKIEKQLSSGELDCATQARFMDMLQGTNASMFQLRVDYFSASFRNELDMRERQSLVNLQNYLQDSIDQVIYGDFTDKRTELGTIAQIGTGLLGVDLPGDIRDLSEKFANWEWTWQHAGSTAVAAVAVVPVIGAVKYLDEGVMFLDKYKNFAETLPGSKTILGLYNTGMTPNYVDVGKVTNSAVLNVDDWDTMTDLEKSFENMGFLDAGIARGDKFILSTPYKQAYEGTGLRWELDYLETKGYQVQTIDGIDVMVKP